MQALLLNVAPVHPLKGTPASPPAEGSPVSPPDMSHPGNMPPDALPDADAETKQYEDIDWEAKAATEAAVLLPTLHEREAFSKVLAYQERTTLRSGEGCSSEVRLRV